MRTENGLAFVLGVGLALLVSAIACDIAYADCSACATCSADPAFVQRDSRNPEILKIIRCLGMTEMRGEEVTTVVVVEGPMDTTQEKKDDVRYTVTLIAASGRTASRALKCDLPAELKAYIGKS